eukprot:3721546-Amphidinium_carterae.3
MRGTDENRTFGYYKTQMAQLPKWTRIEVESDQSYHPVMKDIDGYYTPVDKMWLSCVKTSLPTVVTNQHLCFHHLES